MAVVVQRLVRAEISGVLFTADPVSGSHAHMTGNYVFGLGDALVSGEVKPFTFTLERPKGTYQGPTELESYAGKLFKLARRLEDELGCPQDIEWCIAGRKIFLLQSRPITNLIGHNPATGEWNTCLTGDYLWSNANLSEAAPDVMTPLSCYTNISLMVSMFAAVGMKVENVMSQWGELLGRIPEGMDIPVIPLRGLFTFVSLLPQNLKKRRKLIEGKRIMPEFMTASPGWCREIRERIRKTPTAAQLASLWEDGLKPHYVQACWVLRGVMDQFSGNAFRLHKDLEEMVGAGDANAILSNMRGDSQLASLGPVAGLGKVLQGEITREAYIQDYGHRGPHECELSILSPVDDPSLLDKQLEDLARSSFDLDEMLRAQRLEYHAALERFSSRFPRKVKSTQRRLDQVFEASRKREAVRSEYTRALSVIRVFAHRAGELTDVGEGVFFLTHQELYALLSGDQTPAEHIPARRNTHQRYCALPPLPTIINGRFDPFEWAADDQRRTDVFDSHAPVAVPDSGVITGFPGAAGRVEGLVRRLDRAEEGDQLMQGEILVTTTTNVGWTPLFPRAGAIVTDVGAPLSHAAIVARELGIPAVVGTGNATMRLITGDRVLVDGGRGLVELLDPRD
jgi:pyruvate,water dikinase